VGSLERRLARLEDARRQEEASLGRKALEHLSTQDLVALEDALEAGQENGTATFEDLHRVVKEQHRRALDAYLECIEALREGREPNVSTEVGEEEMRQSRNAYRIWKYYRK
jgi:hypothetical protein